MQGRAQSNNFTEDTAIRIQQLTRQLYANQVANPHGYKATVTSTIRREEESASA